MNQSFDRHEFAKQFGQQLEDELTNLGRDVLDQWLKNTDSELKKLINDILDNSLASIADALAGDGDATFALPSGKQVANTIGKLIETGIEDIFEKKETNTSSRETNRSVDANSQFKESRGQQQARAAQEVSRGNRNL